MLKHMLANVITHEFEKTVGKGQSETGKAMHIGFSLHVQNDDQYRVEHLYLYAPGNYVFVMTQEERIDVEGNRIVGKMKMECYHDSCWRDSVREVIYKNSDVLSTMKAFSPCSDWYDVLTLNEDEKKFLRKMQAWKHGYPYPQQGEDFCEANPFDNRGVWAGK